MIVANNTQACVVSPICNHGMYGGSAKPFSSRGLLLITVFKTNYYNVHYLILIIMKVYFQLPGINIIVLNTAVVV